MLMGKCDVVCAHDSYILIRWTTSYKHPYKILDVSPPPPPPPLDEYTKPTRFREHNECVEPTIMIT